METYSSKTQTDLNKALNDALPIVVKTAAVVTGIEVARVIISHRRLLATIAALAGAAYVTNKGLPKFLTKSSTPKADESKSIDAPSYPGEAVRRAEQEPADEVDEAMMSTFPASDPPPSYHRA